MSKFTIPAATMIVPPDLAVDLLTAVRGGLPSVLVSSRFATWILELEALAGVDGPDRESTTVKVAAELLGVSERRVRAMAQSGTLLAEKRGRWFIDAHHLERVISRRVPVPGGFRSIPTDSARSDVAV
jgi:hypothetical protein